MEKPRSTGGRRGRLGPLANKPIPREGTPSNGRTLGSPEMLDTSRRKWGIASRRKGLIWGWWFAGQRSLGGAEGRGEKRLLIGGENQFHDGQEKGPSS